ncbi:MAG: hypothetical protein IT288_13350 [Bdellovibrionales bacterium]|nr:hypothetical protein [Bdellovibrionales bacterium]
MKFFQNLCIIAALLLAPISKAVTSFEGVVSRVEQTGTYLKVSGLGKEYLVYTRNTHVMNDLRALEAGDYLSAKGLFNYNNSQVEITAIEFVGLKKLLGLWRTGKWEIFDFKNFSNLDLYQPARTRTLNTVELRNLRYTVAPLNGPTWSIYIVDSNSVDVGSLNVTGNSIQIQLFDPDTGAVARTINLTPFKW